MEKKRNLARLTRLTIHEMISNFVAGLAREGSTTLDTHEEKR